jgi:hypothetical protein
MANLHPVFTLEEAVQKTPTLAQLVQRAKTSEQYLRCIGPLLPTTLLQSVAPGPVEDGNWCLVVTGNAVAAKLRQLLPQLVLQLNREGHAIQTIRLKVLSASSGR